jgi:hypothetical protein
MLFNWAFLIGSYCAKSPPFTCLLTHSGLEDNQQCTFAAHSTSINTVYKNFFKSGANREWVQGRETLQSYSSGELAEQASMGQSPLHWKLARPCNKLDSSTNKDAFSGSASHCEPVATCTCLHINWKFQFDVMALALLTFFFDLFFFFLFILFR